MYKTNDYLEEAIINKNIVRIRSFFSVIAHEDPSFSTGKFFQTLEYVKTKNIEGLFVPFDGRTFKLKENWNEEYWALIASSLLDNFCMERIEHLKDIGHTLYQPKRGIIQPTAYRSHSIRMKVKNSVENFLKSGQLISKKGEE